MNINIPDHPPTGEMVGAGVRWVLYHTKLYSIINFTSGLGGRKSGGTKRGVLVAGRPGKQREVQYQDSLLSSHFLLPSHWQQKRTEAGVALAGDTTQART